MKYMRMISGSLLMSMLAACSAPPSGPVQAQSEDVQSSQQAFSGEEMFTGLMLGRGPAASLLKLSGEPLLDANQSQEEFVRNLTEVERTVRTSGATAEVLKKLHSVVETAQRGDLTPASMLGSVGGMELRVVESIRSKDPTYFETFRAHLTSGDHLRIRTALTDAFERVQIETSASTPPTVGIGPECLAVAVAAVVALVVVVAVAFYKVKTVEVDSTSGSNLRQDMLVDRLSQTLAGR